MFVLSNALTEVIGFSESLASVKWPSNEYRSPLTSVAVAMLGFGPSLTQAPDEHLAGEAPVSVHAVLSASLVSAEQTPVTPEQVPAILHCVVAAGHVTPVQVAAQTPEPSQLPAPLPPKVAQLVPAALSVSAGQVPPEQAAATLQSLDAVQVTPVQRAAQAPEPSQLPAPPR